MPQTVGSVPMACGLLEVSFTSDCASWTDISGEDQTVANTAQTRKSGEAYTLDGDTAIIQGGKREPMELQFAIVYTETAGEAYSLIRAQFEAAGCGDPLCARWSPRGGNVGDERITTPAGIIISFTYPPLDAAAGGPIMAGFTLKVSGTTTAAITS